MGWYPEEDREIYTVQELVEKFRIADLGKASPVFDLAKLNWLTGVYMRQALGTAPGRVVEVCLVVLAAHGVISEPASTEQRAYVEQVVCVLGDRLEGGGGGLTRGEVVLNGGHHQPAPGAK